MEFEVRFAHYEALYAARQRQTTRSSSRVTPRVPASKERMRKQSVAADYEAVAISGWRKPISRT